MKNNWVVKVIIGVIWALIGMIGAVMHESVMDAIGPWYLMLSFLIYIIIGMVIILPNEEA